ncbi:MULTISPECIES: Maf family protein [Marinimicrobium]|jgi:MAF protein|uniref:7-methyl-GTP pyrophosphatase n=1 Tax=Marinimicrobium koreense TaxID=306545 RepID=A0A3N1NY48_9GAMM|nr:MULTISPECIES: Maf family nucleotide pyrophosphatase [Marinimicrobium]ROQ20238.1 MAF protein [Marinimicrobium koreense]
MPELLLASRSPYRRQLLERLNLTFTCTAPEVDETPAPGETPEALARRLAHMKARALAPTEAHDLLIIGSDQVATLDGEQCLGKPGDHQRAVEQLRAASGKVVTFYTGLCIYDARTGTDETRCESVRAHFRPLTDTQIEQYLRQETPYDCAGAFKVEGLGICLFERLEGDDPNALIGLPLIQLTEMLQKAGLDPLLMPTASR